LQGGSFAEQNEVLLSGDAGDASMHKSASGKQRYLDNHNLLKI
jgi:hypothetical protein